MHLLWFERKFNVVLEYFLFFFEGGGVVVGGAEEWLGSGGGCGGVNSSLGQ